MLTVAVISRFLHVATAIVLLGGSAYIRFVLLPAARELPDEFHHSLRARMIARWKFFIHGGILLLLVSGFYNYLAVAQPVDAFRKQYHMLMGIKILLALGVFALASILVGRSAREGRQTSAPRLLVMVLILGATIVGLSSYLRVQGTATLRAALPPATSAVQR